MPTQKLYFLKINLNSEIYDLYNGRIKKEDVYNDIKELSFPNRPSAAKNLK